MLVALILCLCNESKLCTTVSDYVVRRAIQSEVIKCTNC